MIGPFASALVALSFLALGAGACVAPGKLAENYGFPSDDPTVHAYVRSLGARDAVLGLLLLTFLRSNDRSALRATVGLSALAGASDFAIVSTARGFAAPGSLAIHGFGTIGLLVVWKFLRSDV